MRSPNITIGVGIGQSKLLPGFVFDIFERLVGEGEREGGKGGEGELCHIALIIISRWVKTVVFDDFRVQELYGGGGRDG